MQGKRGLGSLIAVAALAGSGAVNAATINQGNWGGCLGMTSCVVGDTTITALGDAAAAASKNMPVTTSPTLVQQTFNGATGLGIQYARYPNTTLGNSPNLEIQYSETLNFTFAAPTKIDELQIVFLYSRERFGSDPAEELAYITGGSTTYTLTVTDSNNNPPIFGWNGGGTVSAESPYNQGVFKFLNPFGDTLLTSLSLTAPFLANNTTADNNDYSFLSLSFTSPPAEVPEPSTYAMMLAGLALLGFMARRSKA